MSGSVVSSGMRRTGRVSLAIALVLASAAPAAAASTTFRIEARVPVSCIVHAQTPLEVSDDTNLGSLSIMQILRLPIDKLSDQQLVTVVNRSMLIRQDEALYEVLTAAVARPEWA